MKMDKDNPNYAAVIARANGEKIQFKITNAPNPYWIDWVDDNRTAPNFYADSIEWRAKPKNLIIYCRRYLVGDKSSDSIFRVECANRRDDVDYVCPETLPNFIRWVDTEWTEIELGSRLIRVDSETS